ncbi:single-stranded-DNA-specific exonuclease RecJ [Gammaproteobacteria bacterium]|nr:single-stranded-DNA-specific exonuclease RecJ [Gammaproteobacteria bacterium]
MSQDFVLDKIFRGRGVTCASQIDYELKQLLSYKSLKGIDQAADWLVDALNSGQKVCIIGDYDVDGATSTAVMMKGLSQMGFANLTFIIPNRILDGYGLTPALVKKAHGVGVKYIITVDNGIVSFEGVDCAKALGIEVLITDHHMAQEKVPNCVVVNPNQVGCEFSSKNLAGVGVAFYVLIALRAKLRQINEPGGGVNLLTLIDLVALGTVADCVKLDQNNRLLVAQGLSRIRAGKVSPGILALIKIAKRNVTLLESDDFGFAIAPRLNAAGRLEDMTTGVMCLLAPDIEAASIYASILDKINHNRRNIQAKMLDEATLAVEKTTVDLERVIIIFGSNWHEGVIGLVASMLKEKHHLPTIALAQDADAEIYKGSCRSIPGLNIRDALVEFDRQYPNILIKYGGHAMAAGLSLRKSGFEKFKKGINEILSQIMTSTLLEKILEVDGGLPHSHRTLPFARKMGEVSPWGQGFEKPLFDDQFKIKSIRKIGEVHLKLILEDQGSEFDAIWFSPPEHWLETRAAQLRVIYHMGINDFRGKRSLQLMIKHADEVASH